MCFGVRDAIELALRQAQQRPLTIFGELVHNSTVLSDLRQHGIQIEREAARIPTPDVLITAHGASDRTIEALRARGLSVLEATCPLVHYAHRAAKELVREGYHPIVIGKRDHVEVRGLTEDLAAFDVVLWEADVDRLAEHPRFGVVAQTTQPLEKVRHLVDLIRRRFPASEVRFEDTVCQPTKQRQMAAVELARESEVVVVVGGANSNNTQELVKTCRRFCPRVYHVQDSSQLHPEWFQSAQVVGITAGTSTPDSTISEVGQWLEELANHKAKQSVAEELASPLENCFSPTAESTPASQADALASPTVSSFA